MTITAHESTDSLALERNFAVRASKSPSGPWEMSWGEGSQRCYYACPPELAVLLMTCSPTASRDKWLSVFTTELEIDAQDATSLLDLLVEQGLLTSSRSALTPGEQQWLDVGWSDALQLHWAERNCHWEHDYTGNPKVMTRYDGSNILPTTPPPGPFPCVPDARGQALVLPDPVALNASFAHAQRQRRTAYDFAGTSVTLSDVSTFLWWTLKGQWTDGVAPVRVSQSYSRGEPFVGFVAFGDNPPDGCARRSLYQYDPATNVLAPRSGPVPPKWSDLLWGQHFADDAPMAFILAAQWSHFMWKYRLPRAYRWVYTECGAFMQTALTTATALGMRCWQTPALDDAAFNQLLGYDEAVLSPAYVALLGRPAQKAD
jgi:hypothetical protein